MVKDEFKQQSSKRKLNSQVTNKVSNNLAASITCQSPRLQQDSVDLLEGHFPATRVNQNQLHVLPMDDLSIHTLHDDIYQSIICLIILFDAHFREPHSSGCEEELQRWHAEGAQDLHQYISQQQTSTLQSLRRSPRSKVLHFLNGLSPSPFPSFTTHSILSKSLKSIHSVTTLSSSTS